MTSITPPGAGSLRALRVSAPNRLRRMGIRLQEAWMKRKTLRAIEAMPLDIRKDIGWPTSAPPCDPLPRP